MMHTFHRAALAFGLMAATALAQKGRETLAVYGLDDRQDFYQVSADLQSLGRAVCLIVNDGEVIDNGDGTFTLITQPLATRVAGKSGGTPLCPTERFADQPTAGFCTGVLVAPDVIATAGHCVLDALTCSRSLFIFDFHMISVSEARTTFVAGQIYRCLGLIEGRRAASPGGADWALLKLDRQAFDRLPMTLTGDALVLSGEAMLLLSHPSGLPLKYAGPALVRDALNEDSFQADFDAFEGSSGGAVLSNGLRQLEGIFNAGNLDYVPGPAGCLVANVCPEGGCDNSPVGLRWEVATRAALFREALANAGSAVFGGQDTDGDYFTDAEEIAARTNPLDPNDFPLTRYERVTPCGNVGLWLYPALMASAGLLVIRRRR